jgi:ribosomal protein L24E
MVGADGSVYSLGSAGSLGSLQGQPLNKPVVGMAATPDGHGYWLVASDGGIFAFGDAGFYGSMGGQPLNKPVVGMAATPDGHGYWLVASDGGIFAFGDAGFYGSMGGQPLNKPIVGMAATPDGHGYWLVASDGGIFAFGDALFRGSLASTSLPAPIVGMVMTSSLDPYFPGAAGYDISWPQCDGPYPSPPFSLAVVGVGGSRTFTHNPCLADEVTWFGSATITLYVKLSSPAFGTPEQANTGPAGTCAASDSLCQGYNYGWNLVIDAHRYATTQGVSSDLWWLDVERPASSSDPLWSSDTAANSQVVAGAIDASTDLGLQAGVYSNSYQWPLIVGSYAPLVPMWQARPNAPPATQYCSSNLFTPGPVWLVQYANGPFDQDLACSLRVRDLCRLPCDLRNTGSRLSEGTDPTGAGAHSTASVSSNRASPQGARHRWNEERNEISSSVALSACPIQTGCLLPAPQ